MTGFIGASLGAILDRNGLHDSRLSGFAIIRNDVVHLDRETIVCAYVHSLNLSSHYGFLFLTVAAICQLSKKRQE